MNDINMMTFAWLEDVTVMALLLPKERPLDDPWTSHHRCLYILEESSPICTPKPPNKFWNPSVNCPENYSRIAHVLLLSEGILLHEICCSSCCWNTNLAMHRYCPSKPLEPASLAKNSVRLRSVIAVQSFCLYLWCVAVKYWTKFAA